MRLFAILVILLLLFGTLVVYSALVAASDADDEADLFNDLDEFEGDLDEMIAAAEQRGYESGFYRGYIEGIKDAFERCNDERVKQGGKL